VDVGFVIGSPLEDVLRKAGSPLPSPVQGKALIDTGATGTVIASNIPDLLGLSPVGTAQINTPSSTGVGCFIYLIRLLFPNNVVFQTTAVALPLQGQGIQCLIGRDVLGKAVFIYTGYTNTYTLCF